MCQILKEYLDLQNQFQVLKQNHYLESERINEVFDPEIAVNRAIEYYRNKGYDEEWIKTRLNGILNRKKLTDVWKAGGFKESYEYALLTNEIYKEWSLV